MKEERRNYTKPCILAKEEISPNQAVATCAHGSGNARIIHVGYINQSTYGLENIKSTIEEAQKVNERCPVYDAFYVEVDGQNHGYIYDSVPDAVYDKDKYVNTSDVQGDWNMISNVMKS